MARRRRRARRPPPCANPIGSSRSSARCASSEAVRARMGIAFTVRASKPRSSSTAAIGIETFMTSGRPHAASTPSRIARASATCPPATPRASASSRIRSARGSSGLCTGWPKPGTFRRRRGSPRRPRGPPRRDRRRARGPRRAASRTPPPCRAAPARRRGSPPRPRPGARRGRPRASSARRRSSASSRARRSPRAAGRGTRAARSVGSSPVSSRWKYSVKVRRPIRSPVRSRPRTSTRSGCAWLMWLTGSPGTGGDAIRGTRRRRGSSRRASSASPPRRGRRRSRSPGPRRDRPHRRRWGCA